jgi:pyridoxamine 5'-phosphate oxidase
LPKDTGKRRPDRTCVLALPRSRQVRGAHSKDRSLARWTDGAFHRTTVKSQIMGGLVSRICMNTADLRREYHRATLTETDVDPSPTAQFRRWLAEAVKAELPEPTAMTLATVGDGGRPAARIVLLKAVDAEGFLFFSNYDSRKGRELAGQPFAALLFHWVEMERQVRIEGEVSRAAGAESDAYFASRPRLSRLGAWASPQSREIPDRGWLEREFTSAQERFADHPDSIPRPPYWGGYRLTPSTVEFWQGRPSRLHDRIRYRLEDAYWRIERLAP